MLRSAFVSALLLASSSAVFAQSPHPTGAYPAAQNASLTGAVPNQGSEPDLLSYGATPANGVTGNPADSSPACNPPSAANTVVICQPSQGSGNLALLTVQAASNVSNFVLSRLYLDDQPVYQSTSPVINTSLAAGDGTTYGKHRLVLVSYNTQGQAFTSSSSFNTVPGGTCIPSTPGAVFCAPEVLSSSIVGYQPGPPTVTAGALASAGNIVALRLYVDDVPVLTRFNPSATNTFQFSESVPMATGGSHRLAIVAYQSTGAALVGTSDALVSDAPPCAPTSPGAAICVPGSGPLIHGYIPFSAGTTAATGTITAMRVYVDGISQATVLNPARTASYNINQVLTILTLGTHTLTVVGYQTDGNAVVANRTVTIQ